MKGERVSSVSRLQIGLMDLESITSRHDGRCGLKDLLLICSLPGRCSLSIRHTLSHREALRIRLRLRVRHTLRCSLRRAGESICDAALHGDACGGANG
jgi:hypothetical protein